MNGILQRVLIATGLLVLGLVCYEGVRIYRVYFGPHVYETVSPQVPDRLPGPAILVFSKTNGFREPNAIVAANTALAAIALGRGWSVFFTENGAAFTPAILKRFQATVWNNTSGDVLNAPRKAAFRSYLENGGGFIGIHGAGGDLRCEWRWYVDRFIGAPFKGHPLGPQFSAGDHPYGTPGWNTRRIRSRAIGERMDPGG